MADNAVKPSKLLETWPAAVIDPEGTFKYVLIEGKKFDFRSLNVNVHLNIIPLNGFLIIFHSVCH